MPRTGTGGDNLAMDGVGVWFDGRSHSRLRLWGGRGESIPSKLGVGATMTKVEMGDGMRKRAAQAIAPSAAVYANAAT